MMLAVGFIAIAFLGSVYVLVKLVPRRDRSMRSKEKALRIVTPADVRAARECSDVGHRITARRPLPSSPHHLIGNEPPDFYGSTGGDPAYGPRAAGLDQEQPPDAPGGGPFVVTPTAAPARSFLEAMEAEARAQAIAKERLFRTALFYDQPLTPEQYVDGAQPKGEVQTFGPRKSGYEFGEFDHPPTIDFHSTRVATPSESSTPPAADDVLSPQQSAEGEASAAGGQSGGGE